MADIKFLTLDDLYITPFTARRVYNEDGVISWVPVERKLNPTGVSVIDFIVRSMSNGNCNWLWLARNLQCSLRDIKGLIRTVTNMNADKFRHDYMFRMADELLRYTTMSTTEVAKRAGFTSASSMSQQYARSRKISPKAQRLALQRSIDKGRFRL